MEPTTTVFEPQVAAAPASLSSCGLVSAAGVHVRALGEIQTVAVELPSAAHRVPATVHRPPADGASTAASELDGPFPAFRAGLTLRSQL
jgi:hypothetical protein